MTDNSPNNSLTVWDSIDILARAVLYMQKELSSIASSQKITLKEGAKLSDNTYEAKVVLNNRDIAVLPKIGYHMSDGELIIRNHITKEEVIIPRDFHYLRAIKFDDGNYKLTFCNMLGNKFFDYKRYDEQYCNVPDEYRFIDLGQIKNRSSKFEECLNYIPSFLIMEGSLEPESSNYSADLFEFPRYNADRSV